MTIYKKGAFSMTEYAYYNGVFTPYNAATIPLSDRSVFFSDAVYDVLVGSGKKVYQADEHTDRLLDNARRIGLRNLPTKTELTSIYAELVELGEAEEFILYIQLSSDSKRRSHERGNGGINVLITVTECKIPTEIAEISAITLTDMRHAFCDIKTTSLLPAVLSVEEAKRRGADIAIFHKGGTVTECSYANLLLIADGKVIARPCDSDILDGITQRNIKAVCQRLGIAHEIRCFTLNEVLSADAVMITSTTKLIKLCTKIDDSPLRVTQREIAVRIFDELRSDLLNKTR